MSLVVFHEINSAGWAVWGSCRIPAELGAPAGVNNRSAWESPSWVESSSET